MRMISAVLVGVTVTIGCIAAACGGSNQNQAAQQPSASYAYPQQGQYPPQGQYPQQPPPGQPGYPPPGGQPGYPPPGGQPAGGQLAVPGPMAFPCSSDSQCGTHKCNTQYGKCAFPCETDSDCITGAYCFKSAISTCLPKPPGQ